MEIRDPVHGTIALDDNEVLVLDTPEYQRLRAIKQLGFAEFSFPGATHNRYLHSIGVAHIAGMAFDHVFRAFPFANKQVRQRLRSCLRLAALLHDIGHGPLSHTIEEVMPPLADLKVGAYKNRWANSSTTKSSASVGVRANHEDYTIKYITESPLTQALQEGFPDLEPLHVAQLVDRTLPATDDFFRIEGIDFRPILSQLVSSELDCDRMDYLERDSYFCGTSYGKFDLPWMINNLASFVKDDKMQLALNRRALYTFDDFLISRHHMHLMVYFHHKSIIYEEMLNRYLTSPDCSFFLPANIDEYTKFNDYKLHEHLAHHSNPWAQRLAQRRPYRVLIEMHGSDPARPEAVDKSLRDSGIDSIWASSSARLSKYHSAGNNPSDDAQIFVVDQYDRWAQPMPLSSSTEIFSRYEGARVIDRIYVAPESYQKANRLLAANRLT